MISELWVYAQRSGKEELSTLILCRTWADMMLLFLAVSFTQNLQRLCFDSRDSLPRACFDCPNRNKRWIWSSSISFAYTWVLHWLQFARHAPHCNSSRACYFALSRERGTAHSAVTASQTNALDTTIEYVLPRTSGP